MEFHHFDIITFDCYGTLIDWEGGIVGAFQIEAAKDGVTLNSNEIIAAYSAEEHGVESGEYRTYRDVLAETSRRVAWRLGWQLKAESAGFLADSMTNWKTFEDTNPALERLASRFKLGILSNVDDDLLAKTREEFSVPFDLIVTAQQVKSYKPHYSHFTTALERTRGSKMLHAAQSYFHDVVPARALSIPVVWINRKGERKREDGPSPTAEVRNLSGLADLLGV